jgi:hypothetical protein
MSTQFVGEPPRRRWRPWHFILIGVAVLALFVGVLLYVVLTLTAPIVAGGERFMTALKAGDFEQAYAVSTPELQREFGSAPAMARRVGIYRPVEWSWSQRSIRNGLGELSGGVTFATGTHGQASLELLKVGEEWRVSAFRFNPG